MIVTNKSKMRLEVRYCLSDEREYSCKVVKNRNPELYLLASKFRCWIALTPYIVV